MKKKQEELRIEITENEIKLFDEINNQELDEARKKEYLSSKENYNHLDVYIVESRSDEALRYMENNRVVKSDNTTLVKLAFQTYQDGILALSEEEKRNFPVYQRSLDSKVIKGICNSKEEFDNIHKGTPGTPGEDIKYTTKNNSQFLIPYHRTLHSVVFIQECLKRFGKEGDKFVFRFSQKDKRSFNMINNEEGNTTYKNSYSHVLLESKNVIFRGAPGTGKSYLAKKIAADIISGGSFDKYEKLNDEQKQQVEFVQFHPSYDYTDFVEGLRPKINDDGSMGFELRDGVFKRFVQKAKNDFEGSNKPYIFIIDEINRGEISKILGELFFSIDPGYRGSAGEVSTQYANLHENPQEKFYIPDNVYIIGTMNDIDRSVDSFDFAMRRRFRFIEIKSSEHIAMLDVLDAKKKDAVTRMRSLNNEISKVEELNDNYHIGPSYFLKLQTIDFDQLWTDYISPLLQDYVRGMYGEEEIMKKFKIAYDPIKIQKGNGSNEGDEDADTQN